MAWLVPALLGGLGVGGLQLLSPAKKAKTKQLPTLSPQQQQFQNRLLSLFTNQYGNGVGSSPLFKAGESHLANILSGKPEAFSEFEAPIKEQYFGETVPKLAERFTSLGAQSSSAFNQQLAKSGQDLSTRLAALRSGLQGQAAQQALGYAQAPGSQALSLLSGGLQPNFGYQHIPGTPGAGMQFLSSLAGGAGQGLSQYLMGF